MLKQLTDAVVGLWRISGNGCMTRWFTGQTPFFSRRTV